MIIGSEVYLGEMDRTLKFVKQVINPRDGIPIIYCDLVKFSTVSAHSNRTIFLLNEQHWCAPWSNTWSDKALI